MGNFGLLPSHTEDPGKSWAKGTSDAVFWATPCLSLTPSTYGLHAWGPWAPTEPGTQAAFQGRYSLQGRKGPEDENSFLSAGGQRSVGTQKLLQGQNTLYE